MEELQLEELLQLLRRDSLAVRRELGLFSALQRWADRDCKRRGERVGADNKRLALGEALYHVRYLRMSTEDLLGGVLKSGVLDPAETACILSHAIGKPQDPPDSLRPFMATFSKLRPDPRPRLVRYAVA